MKSFEVKEYLHLNTLEIVNSIASKMSYPKYWLPYVISSTGVKIHLVIYFAQTH